MKRKQISALLAALLAACILNSCGSKDSQNNESEASRSESSAAEQSESDTESSGNSKGTESSTDPDDSSSDEQSPQTTATEIRINENGETYVEYVTNPDQPDTDAGKTEKPADNKDNSQTDAQTDPPPSKKYDITITAETVKAKAGQENVPVKVTVSNNRGVTNGGITIDYPADIRPKVTDENGTLSYKLGMDWISAMTAGTTNDTNGVHRLGFAFFSQDGTNITANSTIFTCYFNIPENAKSGTEYKLDLKPNMFQREGKIEISVEAIDGAIIIE